MAKQKVLQSNLILCHVPPVIALQILVQFFTYTPNLQAELRLLRITYIISIMEQILIKKLPLRIMYQQIITVEFIYLIVKVMLQTQRFKIITLLITIILFIQMHLQLLLQKITILLLLEIQRVMLLSQVKQLTHVMYQDVVIAA